MVDDDVREPGRGEFLEMPEDERLAAGFEQWLWAYGR